MSRVLPVGMARDLGKIKRDDLAQEIIGRVLARVLDIAASRGQTFNRPNLPLPPIPYVPPVHQREILAELESNYNFRGWLRRQVREALRNAHLVKVGSAEPLELPERLARPARVVNGKLTVESDIGLGTASVLDGSPEGWDRWVLDQIDSRRTSLNDDDVFPRAIRVLVIGGGAGGFAKAVTVLSPVPPIRVLQKDWAIDPPTELPCVELPGEHPEALFDAAVVVVPAPSFPGVANCRWIYGAPHAPPVRPDGDPGSMGPTNWLGHVHGQLEAVSLSLLDGSLAYVLFPLGIRVGDHYRNAPDLLKDVLSHLPALGLEVVEQFEVTEVQPVNQPFVADRRPKRVTIVLRKLGEPKGAS